jgi:hypothetical protein
VKVGKPVGCEEPFKDGFRFEYTCAGPLERQVRGIRSGVRPSCMNSRMNSAGRPHLPPSGEIFRSSWA